MNSFPYTAFAQNVGLVGLTGVKSRWVVAAACVLGGAGIVIFGLVAASGIKTLSKVKFEGNHNVMVIAISMGVGMVPIASPHFYHSFPQWAQIILDSGITAGSITAVVLNAVLNPKCNGAQPLR